MGKETSTPAQPNYAEAAQAQGAANVETARAQGRMNNPNIYTPYGSQTVNWGSGQRTFDQSGYDRAMQGYNTAMQGYQPGSWVSQGGDDGSQWVGNPVPNAPDANSFWSQGQSDQPTITQTLSPAQQGLLDSQNRISQNLANVAETGLNRVAGGFERPFDTSGLPGQQNSVQGGNFQSRADGGQIQRGLDFSGAPNLPGVNDFGRERDLVTDALMQRMEPYLRRDEDAMRTRLTNQGLEMGHEAYDADVGSFNKGKNDARLAAIIAGSGEQSRLFDMASRARAQATGETTTQGQYVNQAQQQAFGQGLANANLGNQVAQQQFSQGLANANLGNQGRQQALQEQAYLRSLPLNEINALRTGAQVQNPQFQPYQGVNIGQTPVFNAATAQGQAAQQQYAQDVGQSNAFTQGLFTLGGAVVGGPWGAAIGSQVGRGVR